MSKNTEVKERDRAEIALAILDNLSEDYLVDMTISGELEDLCFGLTMDLNEDKFIKSV